ncbi:MAG: hypothetical protein GX639_00190 [Fibrobacter sp.]|nr:hypothetical protein [Fibrobacter sp.]
MIISVNNTPDTDKFNLLLSSTIINLNSLAELNSHEIAQLKGSDIEPFIKDEMARAAKGTPFENTIELIGGQRFPDIIANKYYGVEVKTTTQNHWRTTGNSVLETTRVDSVERIYMLFAKLADPLEFKCRPYEDVLSDVVVTHSPRYLIDMNLDEGATIFDKIHIPYNQLRKKNNPIEPIINYYREKLKPGEELWWIDADKKKQKSNNLIIRIWNVLSRDEKSRIINNVMVLFPEIFGNGSNKFNRIPAWLVNNESVVCKNIRDLFTAGGKSSIRIGNCTFINASRIFFNLIENFESIKSIIMETPSNELSYYWNSDTKEDTKLFDWIEQVLYYTKRGGNSTDISIVSKLKELCI